VTARDEDLRMPGKRTRREGSIDDEEEEIVADAAPPPIMSLLSWNCRGLGNPQTVRDLRQMVKEKRPKVVFIM
jgi:hypothetical protein